MTQPWALSRAEIDKVLTDSAGPADNDDQSISFAARRKLLQYIVAHSSEPIAKRMLMFEELVRAHGLLGPEKSDG